MADDALSVDVRSVTPTMKAITFPKNAASAHPENHLRTVAMMFTALSEKQSENGHPSPFLRLSLPDAENRVNIYINTSVKIYRTKKLNNGSRVTGSAI